MKKLLLAMAVQGLLSLAPAYADTIIPFAGSFSGVNSAGSGGSFTTFGGPGVGGSIQMIDIIAFHGTGGVSPGGTLFFVASAGGHAEASGVPCSSQVSCGGANVSLTYDGLSYKTMTYYALPAPSGPRLNISLGMSGSMILPADLSATSIQLTIPIIMGGTITFFENGIVSNVVTLSGTGTASVLATSSGPILEGRVPQYFLGTQASVSFTGMAIDPTAVPEPSTWLLMASGLIAIMMRGIVLAGHNWLTLND
jgi:hypothetical protein